MGKEYFTEDIEEETLLVHEPIVKNNDGTITIEARCIVTINGETYDCVKKMRLKK